MVKNISLSKFLDIKKELKRKKKKIVITNGCFDLLHPGHIKIFENSKKLGDILVVLVNSDKSVKKNKGTKRPIQKQKDRLEILRAITWIDYIIIFNDKEPTHLYKKLLPDFMTKGSQYKNNRIAGAKEIKESGGKVVLIKMKGNYSTTSIIKKIKKL